MDDAECAAELELQTPGIALLRFFDVDPFIVPKTMKDGSPITLESLEETLKQREKPELIIFNEDFISQVMNQNKVSLILFTNNINRDKGKSYFKEFQSVSREMFGTFEKEEDEILFVASGASYGIQIRLSEFVGVKESDLPALFIVQPMVDAMTLRY